MANSFGSLYIGSSSIRHHQNAINTTANNLTNVNTTGYVRQQVLFADESYVNFANAAVSKQQSGLGLTIGDVVHARDIFMDKLYRTTSSRAAFYESTYEATYEVETYFQEMEGRQFQEALKDFYNAFNDFAIQPGDATAQNMIIQKASLFLSRSQAIYSGLKSFQNNINTQISEQIDRVNELAKEIYDLNTEITRIEAGGIETAMDLRDTRDAALDELSSLGKIEFSEDVDHVVSVRFENHDLVDEARIYEMAKDTDPVTGFIDPYWPSTSNRLLGRDGYDYVYDFREAISTEMNTDMGSLKALILARGDETPTYYDLFHNDDGTELTCEQYQNGIGMSVMENSMAEFDELVHEMIMSINDLFCPDVGLSDDGSGNLVYYDPYAADANTVLYYTTAATGGSGDLVLAYKDAGGSLQAYKDADGNEIVVRDAAGTTDAKFLDSASCPVGADGELPPRELFERIGCERYTEITAKDGAGNEVKIWKYNEEVVTDASKMYTTMGVNINEDLLKIGSNLPNMMQNTTIHYPLGERSLAIWENESMQLSPYDTENCTFDGFYNKMINELALSGSIYRTTSETLSGAVLAADNKRQEIIGVSTDEELSNMIRYQNGYNAASRYINVIAEMIDTLINSTR